MTDEPVSLPVSEEPETAWSPTAIAWFCVLFNFLPGALLYALNFERFGQPERKKHALWMVSGGALLYLLLFIRYALMADGALAGREGTVRLWILILHVAIAWHLYLRQQNLFVRHIQQGGRKATLLVPVVASVLWLLLLAASSVGIAFLQASRDDKVFANALTLMNKGKNREAEILFRQYKSRNPEEATTYWNLAVIYERTGRSQQAKIELRDLLKIEPENKDAREWLSDMDDP
jgi:tetratricopeptide (TPR) repeat protein